MDRTIYENQRAYLVDRISFNERIKCPRVAAKYKRMLEELDKQYNDENKGV